MVQEKIPIEQVPALRDAIKDCEKALDGFRLAMIGSGKDRPDAELGVDPGKTLLVEIRALKKAALKGPAVV